MIERGLSLDDVLAATGGRLQGRPASPPAFAGVSIDSRTTTPGELFFAIAGGRFDGHDFLAEARARGAAAAVVHREAASTTGLSLIRVEDTTAALARLARHVREGAGIPVVAITGSVGKTTTKDMTASLVSALGPTLKTEGNLNNRYGLPLTLLGLGPEHRFAVLELGMSAAGEMRELSGIARPDLAVITRVAPVHLEFFASLEEIARAKAEILEGLRPSGAAVLNGDDPLVRRIGDAHAGRVIWFGRDRADDVSAENWRGTVRGMRFDLRLGEESVDVALPLAGPHFLTSFLAAAAVAHAWGASADAIAAGALLLKAAAHRGELIALRDGITLLDDTYNSSPLALEAAVQALGLAREGRRVAFVGDMLELGPSGPDLHRESGERVARRLDVLVGVGPLAASFLEGARRAGAREDALHWFADSAAAAGAAPALVRAGDAVLVKGSRGVRMESVVEALVRRFGREGE
jgi:UDP-N-acetylmuramoyl-tripeptide--D-alanyl-D-alanine ligase